MNDLSILPYSYTLCQHCNLFHDHRKSCIRGRVPVLVIPRMECPECGVQYAVERPDKLQVIFRHTTEVSMGIDPASGNSWDGNVFATYGTQKRTGLFPLPYLPVSEDLVDSRIYKCSRQDEVLYRPLAQFFQYV